MSVPENFEVLSITTDATIHNLFKRCEMSKKRFFCFRDRETGAELGTIEIMLTSDNDLLVENPGARTPC
jgi:hypothetical protein